ncbi:hypothetical protein VTL71DRAFT_16353 [Oculimacula yallundae]|uniref:YDG domain-containing protein n=1 Tax=Oculimacula yallundae TaxID=86028 RepID=A0ABR4CE86_9HELO
MGQPSSIALTKEEEIAAAKFRATAFQNPFCEYKESPLFPSRFRRVSDTVSPTSLPTTMNSSAVSTMVSSAVFSINASNPTTAATSPESGPSPDVEKHEYILGAYSPGELVEKGESGSSVSSDSIDWFPSTAVSISPPGSPRKKSYDGVFEGPGTPVDGGNDSLQSNMSTSQSNLSVSKTAQLSPMRITGSPLTLSRPTSLVGSFETGHSDSSVKTLKSYGSSIGDGGDWDFDALLEMTDEVRAVLRAKKDLSTSAMDELSSLLDAFLREESSPRPSTEIDLVIHTRFDQLLKEVLDSIDLISTDRSQETMLIKCNMLKKNWERRFRGMYSNIQKPRTEHMKIDGALQGLTLTSSSGDHSQNWLIKHTRPADLEGSLNLTPGDWWLNMHCALRDGVVGSVDKMLTMGKSEIVALALLEGEETNGPIPNLYEYTKISQKVGELMKLVTCNRGSPIRVLRGSNLMSKFAPRAGIRYDGLHVVRQFGHKLLDEAKNIYRCTIMLERIPGQRPLHEVLQLPKPSQLDDWDLYKKMINEDYRRCEGDAALSRRTEQEEEHQSDKEQFIKSKALQEGLHRYTAMDRKLNSLQK